jgi:hypothetical protein
MKRQQTITPEEYKALAREEWNEAEFLTAIIDLAGQNSWLRFHARPAQTKIGWRTGYQGDDGFPDAVFLRNGRQIVFEAKVGHNKPTVAQLSWLVAYKECGAETFTVYPRDWSMIEQLLA